MIYSDSKNQAILKKLDLDIYVNTFQSFFARAKEVTIEGDINQHYRYIMALSDIEFPEPKEVPNLQVQLNRLRKQAILSLDDLHAFTMIISYFNRLKSVTLPEPLSSWIQSIEIPDEIYDILGYFTDEGDINPEIEPDIADINRSIKLNKKSIKESLYSLSHSSKLSDFLVDTQIHLQNGEETLLVRGGFNQAIKAAVVGRSSAGFFYILPQSISHLKEQGLDLQSKKDEIVWRYCRDFSAVFHKWERFLRFINKEYDRFDHYQARVKFAKAYEYEFILPSKEKVVLLEEFAHPAIEKPVPVTINMSKPIMLITGVNAGGKTMLLKSILSAVYMSKYLLPFRCNSSKTVIGKYKGVEAIIDDPQSVKNDISTFAGRMLEFSKLSSKKDAIVGVDEIELGTDADEAASLFKVLLEDLKRKGLSFIVTTHHKRLASLMASDEDVDLVAALYDEERRVPTYTFLQGSIGKSYAFETAERYGISPLVVDRAKKFYGEDKEKLNELIEKSTTLEREMRQKILDIDKQSENIKKKQEQMLRLEDDLREEQRKAIITLENRYNAATKRAKEALKTKDVSDGRRLLNEAHKHKLKTKDTKQNKKIRSEERVAQNLVAGDRVKYRSHRGELISIKGKEATIIVDGLKIRVPAIDVKKSVDNIKQKKPISKTTVEKSGATLSIKLLGMFGDEAIDKVDKFISDALVHGLNEVEIIHGTGGGILAKLVTQYLQDHPKINHFYRVPGNLGATIVEL